MYVKIRFLILSLILGLASVVSLFAQSSREKDSEELRYLREQFDNLNHRLDQLAKSIDDVLWHHNVGDVAYVDKVQFVGPPPANRPNPTAQGADNPVRFASYIFIPKTIDRSRKYPLLVFPHGGVHSNFSTYYTHIIRELMAQGYLVIAPEYRGSTGYGRAMYRLIDYGGLEIEDVHASRNHMLENYPFVDKNRVGILGWSHGGLITLMNIFNYPEDYQVAFAGVPVSDLVARMGYKTEEYRQEFAADYHLGKDAYENVEEYRRRSPAWHAEKLQTPLLIHTNTNDEDVNVLEVEHLIQALKAAGKKFEYEIFQKAPGGHGFDRIDTMLAKEVRLKIYRFLAARLNPPNPLKSVDDLAKAGYR
ncbi:MAG: prolyl oligopeptidase family serine peptidase [candidate division KSB1 bacterium]|nr:prolyl oligopeptidase family serine peptidase [candidate division KSB1 bacterium]MDZ7303922.1 prolyl oligopeptidase family serine peptidase [candidate division KSB1 bacterium]MDZ7313083.1 prolyl oligopeptidase family serine peptidase [candidate division KSB1 bacterium]